MIQIRPVSGLRNKISEIEKLVNEGQPVYLKKTDMDRYMRIYDCETDVVG